METVKGRHFKGVWIPAELYKDRSLTWTQKLLLIEVDSFSRHGRECFVSNEHLSEHLQIGISAVEKCLKSLVDAGYIERGRTRTEYGYRRTLRLTTRIDSGQDPEPVTGGTRNELRHTNTDTKPDTKPMKRKHPESLDEVRAYFVQWSADHTDAEKFYDYYTANGWTQGKGKPIKDWMAAARNWMRNTKQWSNDRQAKNSGFQQSNFNPDTLHGYITGG